MEDNVVKDVVMGVFESESEPEEVKSEGVPIGETVEEKLVAARDDEIDDGPLEILVPVVGGIVACSVEVIC